MRRSAIACAHGETKKVEIPTDICYNNITYNSSEDSMDLTEKKIEEISRYSGILMDVRVDRVELPGGKQSKREIAEHPEGVTILPLDKNGDVYCVRQYRYAFSTDILEIPAGKLEPGEEPMAAAVRELGEETGIIAERIDPLGAFMMSPGFCTEVLHIYLARELHFGIAHPDEDELLNVEKYSLQTLLDMVMRGNICDAKSAIAILKTARFLEKEAER